MRVEYWCKHCKHLVGALDRPEWSQADAERYCGLQQLSPAERMEWVSVYGSQGVMTVQTICQHCQQAVEQHPELLIEGKVLQ
ncbi:hypothetical protein GCM10025857_18870 [Alicyclobacillus contaminans]|uniref:anti-sigma-F factor Fin n=1 Tax=Alicyclobacillus contaminans TaxID=392016 RepID=UPI00040B7286|nr:anti-sigma-F factor Fin [Alicyclobacillus contaminans]GMA50530.1 hypothetical protein GCM10025857_18870 [Alicyclobacillus contaminans]